MRLPEFTAEASLGKVKDHYALAVGHAQESGIVLPQSCRCAYIEGEFVCWCSPIRAHI